MTKLHHNAIDLTGQSYGRLTALRPMRKRANSGQIVWKCICDCGNEVFVNSGSLRSGHTQSCGCLQKEKSTTHGMSGTSVFKTWWHMIERCENPKDPAYKNYGGRGVTVCERWHDPRNFYADMGNRPKGLTLERIDNDGNYEPGNCEWATWKKQNNNRRLRTPGYIRRWFYGHGPNGEMIIEGNQTYVAKIFDLSISKISNCLHGKRNHHKDWTFQWIPK